MKKSLSANRSRHLVALTVVAVLLVAFAVVFPREARRDVLPAGALPFDMPAPAELRSSPRKVFVNYFTPVPLSVDNREAESDYYSRNFLTPTGEGGQHAAYGGLFRDRPLPRTPLAGDDWRLQDLKTEVGQAAAAGIDGFYLDILQIEGDPDVRVWETTQLMMRAAAEADPGFEIVLMPDLAGGLRKKTPAQLAAATATLATSDSAYRLPDGRLVVMPLAAEAHPVAWWNRYMSLMESRYGTQVALVPIFIKSEARYREDFAQISYAMSIWGSANPLWNNPGLTHPTSARGRAAAVQALGPNWMQPVRVQDERPKQGLFSEAENTTNLRTTWQLARETNASWVHMPTWNDYSEGTQLAPSSQHGYTFLDINAYYLVWFKTGVAPAIVQDVAYVTHRQQAWQTVPSSDQQLLMKLRGGSPARDTVEVLTFLTAPATVTVTVGAQTSTCAAPAGVGVCTVPLKPGKVEAVITRGSETVTRVDSPYPVTATPYVQDLQYVGASSARSPVDAPLAILATTAPAPAPPVPNTPVEGKRIRLTPQFDGYVNQGSHNASYASSSSLASRGRPGYVSYLRFVVPALDRRRLVDARLRFTTANSDIAGSKDRHLVHLLVGHEVGPATTWTNRPPQTGPQLGSIEGAKRAQGYEVALDTRPLRELEGSTLVLAISSTGTDNLWLLSSDAEAAGQRPQLTLTYRE